jgi:polysaccharide deacetylase family protein (PEP-CTERM system associated)
VRTHRFLASFDIEDWFHAENLSSSLPSTDWEVLEARVERNTHELLDILAETGARSTFFVLGWVARRYPGLVRRIIDEGHELASHTDAHRLLYNMSRADLLSDLQQARETLEQLAGVRVWGLRAPNFSIDDWVLDCLAEAGYWYDSSLFPLKAHDRYGHVSAAIDSDAAVVRVRGELLELPLSQVRMGPFTLPWAGGGYFRLIPYPLFRLGVASRLRSNAWFMFYFHPWELDREEVPPRGMPRILKFRAYVGRHRMRQDLKRLLTEFGSARIDLTLRALGYAPPGEST